MCTYKGKTVPCIVELSEGGGVSGHVLTDVLSHLDYLKLYGNNTKNSVIPDMLVNGHVIRFDLGFLKYICDENQKWTVFLVFRIENHCGR